MLQGEELTRCDAVLAVARREQQPALDLPAIPADPRHEAREDRQQPNRRRCRVARREPTAISARVHAKDGRRLSFGQLQAPLQRP